MRFLPLLALFISLSVQAGPDIIGGDKVKSNDIIAKSTVGIFYGDRIICTGTLVASNIILTAAHCLHNPLDQMLDISQMRIGYGLNQYSNNVMTYPVLQYAMLNYVENKRNDMALLLHQGSVPNGFQRAHFFWPDSFAKIKDDLVGKKLNVAGFGVRKLNADENGTLYKGSVEVSYYHDDRTLVTIESDGVSTCKGDSGGPLYQIREDKVVLVGITSAGDDSCKKFGLYTLIPALDEYLHSMKKTLYESVGMNENTGLFLYYSIPE